jgi:flagellin
MSIIVNSNLTAFSMQKSVNEARASLEISAERMSSGLRLNSAQDDAASFVIKTRMGGTISAIEQGQRNALDAISALHTAEGALGDIHEMLLRVQELAVQAAGGTLNFEQRMQLENEAKGLLQEIDRIKDVTQFNGMTLLDGTFADKRVHLGSDLDGDLSITIPGSDTRRLFDIEPAATFENGDFDIDAADIQTNGSTVTFPGWVVELSRVDLETDQIAGFVSPESNPYPATTPNADNNVPAVMGNYQYSLAGDELRLVLSGITTAQGFDVVHGPYIVSDAAVSISAGATVSFDWRAENGVDDFDVFAYLLNTDTGETITLLNENGGVDGGTVSTQVANDGSYKFVFVAGTHDKTGFNAAGASLYIDNVDVTNNIPPTPYNEMVNFSTAETTSESVTAVLGAIAKLGNDRAILGAIANRIDYTLSSLQVNGLMYHSTSSRIGDADYAVESSNLAKKNILIEAATAMLVQANTSVNQTLSLLK